MSSLERLEEFFRAFPGIGPRQARRFVYFLLSRDQGYRHELAKFIEGLGAETAQCGKCYRFYTKNGKETGLCSICSSASREAHTLLVVEKDVDIEAVEKSGYKGLYVVLGGTIPLATETPDEYARLPLLLKRIEEDAKNGLQEVILGLSATTEGDHTRLLIEERLAPLSAEKGFKVSVLGRGLSTGSEIEYADPETIKQALGSRR